MKKMITVLFVILASFLTAQNWSPILVNEKMNYQHSDSTYISHTIWVDSVETNGDNMIYHLNRIVKDVPDNPEIVLRNQPQFLLKQMTDQNLGYYLFSYPGEIVIKSLAGIGDGWVFNQQSFILAEVSSVAQEDVFGVQDSVKVISLSDGNEIRLSKNFGILNFPDFENGGNYELVGIQNTGYGVSVPDFWDIFDFEIGDVFQYELNELDASWHRYEIQKFIVESKDFSSNSVTYQMNKLINGYTIDYINWEQSDYSYWDNLPVTWMDSANHPSNTFSNELVKMWDDYWPYPWYLTFFSRTVISQDSLGNRTKTIGSLTTSLEEYEIYVEISPFNDTLIREQGYDTYDVLVEYTAGLGRTIYYFVEDEQILNLHLIGYIKNGDTIGTITPDSLLLVGTLETNEGNHSVIVFPNPAKESVNFKFSSTEINANCTIEIMNLLGEIAIKEEVNGSEIITLDIGNLKPGIYFYSIKENGLVIQKDKLIIQ